MAHGHRYAKKYPLATLWYEAQLNRERINAQIATEAIMFDAAIKSILSPKSNRHFGNLLRKLERGG